MNRRMLLPILIAISLAVVPESRAQSIRVATYNVNWGNRRGDQVLDAIGESAADIICFQETTEQSERFLKEHLQVDFPHFFSAGHNGLYLAERFAFASKLELHDLDYRPPQDGLFGYCATTVKLKTIDVRIINVHLTPFLIPRNAGFLQAAHAVSATETKHAREVDAILKSVNPRMPTIIAGDFNSLSSSVAPLRLTEHGFTDSFAALHESPDGHPTWHWPSRPLPLRFRIDYIFHTDSLRPTESRVITRAGSESFPGRQQTGAACWRSEC